MKKKNHKKIIKKTNKFARENYFTKNRPREAQFLKKLRKIHPMTL